MAARPHDVTRARAALVVLVAVAAQASCGSDRAAPHRAKRSPAPSPGATASATPVPTPAGLAPGPPRTHDDVVAAIRGRRVRVKGRAIGVDAGTVACGGIGHPTGRVHGRPAWTRFRCIQPTFPKGSVAGPDLVFVVASAAPRELVVERPRLTSY